MTQLIRNTICAGLLSLAFVLMSALTVVPSFALDIKVTKVTKNMMSQHMQASPSAARERVANFTTLVKVRNFPRRLQKLLPMSGVAVVYFNSNGTMLVWSSKSDKVEVGKWFLKGNMNDICFTFPQGNGAGVCSIFLASTRLVEETTRGNPFNLKANAPVPFSLGRFGVSLSNIARKID